MVIILGNTRQHATKLDEPERTRLRKQALDWLRADFAAWTILADDAQEHARIRRTANTGSRTPTSPASATRTPSG